MISGTYSLSRDFALRNGDVGSGGFLLFDLASGKIYKLNKVSYAMLESFDGKRSTEEILQHLTTRFCVEPSRLTTDFAAQVTQWVKLGILQEVMSPAQV